MVDAFDVEGDDGILLAGTAVDVHTGDGVHLF